MASVKVQLVRRKDVECLDFQSPIKDRLATVLWATIVILLLVALSLLVYFASVMFVANEGQVSHPVSSGGIQLNPRALSCSGMYMVPKNASRYVEHPSPLSPNGRGNRCAFVIFSETKEVKISFANYSFQGSSNPEFIVAELSDAGGDELKYSKLDYSRGQVAKVPAVIYYTSDGDEKQSTFVITVSPIQCSGSSTGIPETGSIRPYEQIGAINHHYPWAAPYPMHYLAVFDAPPTSQPSRHFTCTPRNSTCCNAIFLYQLPTAKFGGIASRLTGLSTTSGVEVSSEVTVLMMFGLPSNYDAMAAGSSCLFEWHAVSEFTIEVDTRY